MKTRSLVLISVFTVSILLFCAIALVPVKASTQDQINALLKQINQINALIQSLKAGQASPAPAPAPSPSASTQTTWCHTFNTNLGYAQSGTAEVGYLHTALQKQGFSFVPDTGNTYYTGTANAVARFQKKYKISQTGYVGDKTRVQLNTLYGCLVSSGTARSGSSTVGTSTITVIFPNGGELWEYGSTHEIEWTATGVTDNVQIYAQDSSIPPNYNNLVATVPASQGTYSWKIENIRPGDSSKYKISVDSLDIVSLWDASDNFFSVNIKCTDTDGGPDRYAEGTTWGIQYIYPTPTPLPVYGGSTDYCSGSTLTEFYCAADGKNIGSATYTCTYGCAENHAGACAGSAPTCTSFTYSDWSACSIDGTQTRTIISSSPTGCTGGIPEALTRSCVYGCPEIATTSEPLKPMWKAISGDWNGDGKDTIGAYEPGTSTFYLRNSNSAGYADMTFGFGSPGSDWEPIAGDWNGDGTDTVGLYDPATSIFYLRNSNTIGNADLTFGFGAPKKYWQPIAGNWDKSGGDTIGLYDSSTSIFYLRNSNTVGAADMQFGFGAPDSGWRPIAGDWNNDSTTTIGLYDPFNNTFYLRNTNTIGAADMQFGFGPSGIMYFPIAGDWDKQKGESIGLYDPIESNFYLTDTNVIGFASAQFGFGQGVELGTSEAPDVLPSCVSTGNRSSQARSALSASALPTQSAAVGSTIPASETKIQIFWASCTGCVTHLDCIAGKCTEATDAGTSDAGCTGATAGASCHLVCPSGTCTSASGAGTDACSPVGSSCGVSTHKVCQGSTCTTVSGAGQSICSTNANCGSSPYHYDCISNTCSYATGSGQNEGGCTKEGDYCSIPTGYCGDGDCKFPESCRPPNPNYCPTDCGTCICGDGTCTVTVEYSEDCHSCPQDCPTQIACGDGFCGCGETCASCFPSECGPCGSECGDGICAVSEDCSVCSIDCGECPVTLSKSESSNWLASLWASIINFLKSSLAGFQDLFVLNPASVASTAAGTCTTPVSNVAVASSGYKTELGPVIDDPSTPSGNTAEDILHAICGYQQLPGCGSSEGNYKAPGCYDDSTINRSNPEDQDSYFLKPYYVIFAKKDCDEKCSVTTGKAPNCRGGQTSIANFYMGNPDNPRSCEYTQTFSPKIHFWQLSQEQWNIITAWGGSRFTSMVQEMINNTRNHELHHNDLASPAVATWGSALSTMVLDGFYRSGSNCMDDFESSIADTVDGSIDKYEMDLFCGPQKDYDATYWQNNPNESSVAHYVCDRFRPPYVPAITYDVCASR